MRDNFILLISISIWDRYVEEGIKGIALLLQSVFKGVSVISSRKTPKHRDGKRRSKWFDLLAKFFQVGSDPPKIFSL